MFIREQGVALRPIPLGGFVRILSWILLMMSALQAASAEDWRVVYVSGPAQVEALRTTSGFDRHRGLVSVCGAMTEVTAFAADVEAFPEWVSFTEESRLISRDPERTLFYLRNSAPWPWKSRDMVYELIPEIVDEHTVRVAMNGLPAALPEVRGVVRISVAEGEWYFHAEQGGELEVTLSLYVEPGRAPKLFANRRSAHMIGDTLAALAQRFPCSTSAQQATQTQ